MSPNAAPWTRIGLTLLNTSASGTTPRSRISRNIHALTTPPLAASSTSTRPAYDWPARRWPGRENVPASRSRS